MELEFVNVLNTGTRGHILPAVSAGRYFLSIQASSGHYCTPRETVPVTQYSSMEMCIFTATSTRFLDVRMSSTIRSFPRYLELLECMDAGGQVFGWVSVDLINDLYLYLSQV